MKSKIIVFNIDLDFAKRLATSLNIKLKDKAAFIPFCDYKLMREYEKENDVCLIIIISENQIEISDYKCKKIVVLRENKNESVTNYDNIDEVKTLLDKEKIIYLYKFQNLDNLKKKIENVLKCVEVKEEVLVDTLQTKNIVLYSPISNIKCKKFFYNMAQEYSRRNSCLFLQLNEMSLTQTKKNFSNLIYYYKGKELNKDIIISQIERKSKLYIIPGVSFPDDMALLSPIDLVNIVNVISFELKIDYMFLDVDSSFVRNQFILQSANQILIPEASSEIEKEILTKFKKYIKKNNCLNIKGIKEISCDNTI